MEHLTNFLKETIDFLSKNGKTPDDVISIGTDKYRMSWNTFARHANVNYDSGFGGCEIMKNIRIYGKDFISH